MTFIIHCIEQVYYFLWGDWIRLPLPGGTLSLPLLVLLLIPAGIYFTVRTRGLQLRLLPDMVRLVTGSAKPEDSEQDRKSEELSALQALIVSTATRVGMGNLVGVVAAISAGGAGAGDLPDHVRPLRARRKRTARPPSHHPVQAL